MLASSMMKQVILFDGVCNLCNGFVDVLLRVDRDELFLLAPLQSDVGKKLLAQAGFAQGMNLDSVVLVQCQNETWSALAKADAVAEILRQLPRPWCWASTMRHLSPKVLESSYEWVASKRYQFFGKREACRMPKPQELKRFLTNTSDL